MQSWILSLRTEPGSGLPSVDVHVRARPDATVAELARALGRHVAPGQDRLHLVPLEGGHPWPADRPVAECGLRTGDLLDVVSAPESWLTSVSAAARTRAVVRVTGGPDRGRRLHVRGSSLTLGRGTSCTLRLSDPLVSQRHARVVLGARPVVYDEGSANGTVVNGQPLVGGREVDWDTPITLGRSTVVVSVGDAPVEEPSVSVFRAPRFGEPLAEGVLDVPAPPSKTRPSPMPWAMLAMPVVLGFAILMRTQSLYALVYLLAWPAVGYLGWRQQKRAAQRQFEEDLASWRVDVDELLTTLDEAARAQRTRVWDDHPDTELVLDRAATRDPYLWARAEDRSDFLVARLGVGSVAAALRGSIKDGGDRDSRRGVAAELVDRDTLPGMPVLADLTDHSLVAITGDAADVDALVRSLVLRLAFDHAPTDLSVAAALGPARRGHETWLRWLPHCATRLGGHAPVAVGPRDAAVLLDHLVSEDSSQGHTICLVDEHAGMSRRTLEAVALTAADRRLHLVWLGRDAAEVPAATGLLVDLDGHVVGLRDRAGLDQVDRFDGIALDVAWRGARSMTGYVDEAAVLLADTALPPLVRVPELTTDLQDLDDAEAVRRRWGQASGLRAQIGAGVDGVVTLDLREDGPHGLIAGTTGSGKSELLQSLICSLALNNSPSRITFLLVDYKGGSAFRECADLPHTVGYITDLTPALVQRALTSLGAEITAREHLLAEHGVKDLAQLERERPDLAPPSLLICVDEFAALTTEVPAFVDGMVNIAQRGRSLGMHVLLATQRPAGVVTGNIRANADLRIALRTASADDSRDVLDSPDAARISRRTPGRAWIRRTGHGTAELVQSAWTGAREPVTGTGDLVEVDRFSALDGPAGDPAGGGDSQRFDARTDLERCVATVGRAFALSGEAAPRRPWLPALPDELLIDRDAEIEAARARGAEGAGSGHVVLGRLDDPAGQRQPELVVDLAAVGHLLVHGASGSGKTELLRTAALMASLGDSFGGYGIAPYIYAIDHGGGGLAAIAGLPTVAAVAPESAPGRVLRLVRLLRRTMQERTAALAHHGCADLDDLARAGHPLPRVYVLVDNLPALVESLEGGGAQSREHLEHLQSVLQNGRRVGIHLIATAPGRTGVPTALAATFGRRVVLRMTQADDYLMLGVPGGVLDPESAPGAGLLGSRTVQVLTTGGAGTPVQAERIAGIAAALAPYVEGRAAAPVPAMPARVEPSALPSPTGTRVPLGVDADAVAVLEPDLLAGPVLIAGRARSGRTSALDSVVELAGRGDRPPHVVRTDDPASAAEELGTWLATDPAGPGGPEPERSGSWALVVVDGADLWDTGAADDESLRTARDQVVRMIADHGDRVAVVATADTSAARLRSVPEGLVALVRRSRRGFLIQPEWSDGEVFGVTVPTTTVEPLSGVGRGLWCEGGVAIVAQLASTTTGSPR